MRFHGQDDQVLGTSGSVIIAGLHVGRHMLLSVMHDELHAVFPDRGQIGATHHESYVFPGQCQLNANIPANGACSNDCNFHAVFP